MNKTEILKRLDAIIGPLAVTVAKALIKPRRGGAGEPASILIIRPGGIGDAVLLIPALNAIKEKYQGAEIDILAEKRNGEIFSFFPGINRLYLYDKPGGIFKALGKRYDIVIDTEQWYRLSAVIACLTRAPVRIGFDTNIRGWLFNRRAPYSQKDYEVESFLKLVSHVTGETAFDPERPFISPPREATEKIAPMLSNLSGKKMVAIFPGGSVPEKRWPSDRFRETAVQLTKWGYGIIVVGGEGEEADGKVIADGLPHAVNLCGRLSLTETAAVMKEASLLITNDSGIMHLAFGMGVKTLSLFGPGDERKWAPKGKNHIVITKNIDCSPCTRFGNTPGCRRNMECMRQIAVEEVAGKAIEMLER